MLIPESLFEYVSCLQAYIQDGEKSNCASISLTQNSILSEPLWFIEARNAAIANSYFTVGINRVGTVI
jgi:hypothetical protein